jgi:threonylcarbamoyladenosine tRNA methylthiotransferase MtaB
LNSADSALLVSRLTAAGYEIADSAPDAALIVVNSCTVTAEAARKSRYAVRKFRAKSPDALIVVTGCSAEFDREAFIKDGAADVVLTNPQKRALPELILEYLAGHNLPNDHAPKSVNEPEKSFREEAFESFPFRNRASIKVQEGCNNFCSYCIVPFVRGPERSRAFDEVLSNAQHAVDAGFPEIVLTGVNICAYSDSGRDLSALIREIAQIDGDFRIRLSSTEPAPGNRTLLEVMATEPKVCRFLHLALQNGSDRILAAMKRRYTTRDYAEFVRFAREKIPGIHLGSDLIVGFPGETEADFEECCNFVKAMNFANLHIFSFSPRKGTVAATLPGRVKPQIVKERYRRLSTMAEESKRHFIESQYGQKLPVIFERVDSDNYARGWSDNYIEFRVPAQDIELNKIMYVEATVQNTKTL